MTNEAETWCSAAALPPRKHLIHRVSAGYFFQATSNPIHKSDRSLVALVFGFEIRFGQSFSCPLHVCRCSSDGKQTFHFTALHATHKHNSFTHSTALTLHYFMRRCAMHFLTSFLPETVHVFVLLALLIFDSLDVRVTGNVRASFFLVNRIGMPYI